MGGGRVEKVDKRRSRGMINCSSSNYQLVQLTEMRGESSIRPFLTFPSFADLESIRLIIYYCRVSLPFSLVQLVRNTCLECDIFIVVDRILICLKSSAEGFNLK